MNAEIIAVGSELLLGQIANTNAQFISEKLAEIGVNVYYHTVVGDNSERLLSAIRQARARASLIIFTGGLGPTRDDLTKETIAASLQKTLVYDEEALKSIQAYFIKVGRQMTENNKKQALVIDGATVLKNHYGMAPGMIVTDQTHTYILLPGPPSEMKPMFTGEVTPFLLEKNSGQIVSRVMRFFGIGESALETKLIDIIEGQSNPTIAPLAKQGEVTLRLTAKHQSIDAANLLLDDIEKQILHRVGDYFYGYGDTLLPEVVFSSLLSANKTVAAAESLTGGLFSQWITHYSGASTIFKGSVVCYTNEVKERLLFVPKEILEYHGAVSEACAIELAKNTRKLLNSDIGISFTGVAGPNMSEGKEVGTVFIGLATEEESFCLPLNLNGTRDAIRHRTMLYGFDLIRRRCV